MGSGDETKPRYIIKNNNKQLTQHNITGFNPRGALGGKGPPRFPVAPSSIWHHYHMYHAKHNVRPPKFIQLFTLHPQGHASRLNPVLCTHNCITKIIMLPTHSCSGYTTSCTMKTFRALLSCHVLTVCWIDIHHVLSKTMPHNCLCLSTTETESPCCNFTVTKILQLSCICMHVGVLTCSITHNVCTTFISSSQKSIKSYRTMHILIKAVATIPVHAHFIQGWLLFQSWRSWISA